MRGTAANRAGNTPPYPHRFPAPLSGQARVHLFEIGKPIRHGSNGNVTTRAREEVCYRCYLPCMGQSMAEGMYRTSKPGLGECVRMDWGAEPESFLTKDTYVARRLLPPYDELPTEEQWRQDRRDEWNPNA